MRVEFQFNRDFQNPMAGYTKHTYIVCIFAPKVFIKIFYTLPTLPPPRNCHKEIQKKNKKIKKTQKHGPHIFCCMRKKWSDLYLTQWIGRRRVTVCTFIWVRYLRVRICVRECICVSCGCTHTHPHITRSLWYIKHKPGQHLPGLGSLSPL